MGTTLTGTTPQDTYDSLIKVTDNGPLSGTAKYLSDGLGNDSAMSLSTTSVGIGTNSPSEKLHIVGAADVTVRLQRTGVRELNLSSSGITATSEFLYLTSDYGALSAIALTTNSAERVRISATGNVGIGTTTPAAKLDVNGGNIHSFYTYSGGGANYNLRIGNDLDPSQFGYFSQLGGSTFVANNNYYALAGQFTPTATTASFIGLEGGNVAFFCNTGLTAGTNYTPTERARFTPNGLTFNGDTLAANALDDYEEGTFTPTIIGSTTAGTATYGGGQAGTYTKIGNVVYFQIYLGYSGGTGTGNLRIAGLPFTIPNDLPSFTFGAFLNVALTASNIPIAGGIVSTNQITIEQIPTGGGSQTAVPYDGSGVIQISGFYRV